MALSYSLRVACVIALSLGLLQIIFEVILGFVAHLAPRFVRPLTLRWQERTLFFVQLAPVTLSLLLTASFLLPHYIANESNFGAERVGWFCLPFAASFYAWWGVRLFRGLRMAVRTSLYSRTFRTGTHSSIAAGLPPVIPVAGSSPRVALIGLTRPFISIPKSLLEPDVLAPQALQVVLDHELSHATQRDNWKLLTLHCIPRLDIRLSQSKTLMQRWQSAAEWAADEDAVAGSLDRALLLAETLVQLSRLSSAARPQLVCTYLVCEDVDLALRIEHLLDIRPDRASFSVNKLAACYAIAFITVTSFAALSFAFRDLPEHLLHLG